MQKNKDKAQRDIEQVAVTPERIQVEFMLDNDEKELMDKYLTLLNEVNTKIAEMSRQKKDMISLLGQLWKSAHRRIQLQDKSLTNLVFPPLINTDGNVLFVNISKNGLAKLSLIAPIVDNGESQEKLEETPKETIEETPKEIQEEDK